MNNATSKRQPAQQAGTPGTPSVTLSIPCASPVPQRLQDNSSSCHLFIFIPWAAQEDFKAVPQSTG